MLAGAARGLNYVHNEIGLTHCDVKPENFMVTLAMDLKVADFGVSGRESALSVPTTLYTK